MSAATSAPTLAGGRRWRPLAAVAALAVLAPLAPAARASASPCTDARPGGDWATYGQDPMGAQHQTAPDHEITADNVDRLTRVWSTGDKGYQSPPPIVSGGCVFINTGGHIEALDLDTGALVWSSAVTAPELNTAGTFAVTVVDGLVHLSLYNGGAPQAAAIRADDGTFVWRSRPITFGHRTNQMSSAIVHEGIRVLFTTGPDFDPAARQGYALLDAATGTVLHEQTTLSAADLDAGYAGGGVWGTPTVDPVDDYLYVGTSNPESKTREHPYDNAVIKIDLRRERTGTFGTVVGSYKGTPDSVTGYDNPVCQTVGDVAWYDAGSYGSSPTCGQLDVDFGVGPTLWRPTSGPHAGRLLGAATQKSGVLHVFDAETMEGVWQRQVWVSMSFLGGNIGRIATDGETLYVPANPGVLYAIDAATFEERWATPVFGLVPMKGGNVALAGGVVYYTNEDDLKALDAATGEVLWTSTFTPGASIGSGVAVAGNHVVANHYGNIAAYRLGEGSADPGPEVPAQVAGVLDGATRPQVVAGPGAAFAGYATRDVLVPAGSTASFLNADAFAHDVISDALGGNGHPLFRSALIGPGATPVEGVEDLPPGSYGFFCSLHANSMRGTLTVV